MSGITRLHRRLLLAGLAALPAASLVGCVSGPEIPPAALSDLNLIANALKALMPQLGVVSGLSAAAINTATQAIMDIQTAADAAATADTIVAARPLVIRITTDVNSVVDALSAVSLPEGFTRTLQAASVLVPIIEAAVGLAIPAGTEAGAMTPPQARAWLHTISIPITK